MTYLHIASREEESFMEAFFKAKHEGRLLPTYEAPVLCREDHPELQKAEEVFIAAVVQAAGALCGHDPYADPLQQAITAEALCVTERSALRAEVREALRHRQASREPARAEFMTGFMYATRRGVIGLCHSLISKHRQEAQAIAERHIPLNLSNPETACHN